MAISLGESLHHSVYFLSLAWQSETPEELSKGLNQDQVGEIVELNKRLENKELYSFLKA